MSTLARTVKDVRPFDLVLTAHLDIVTCIQRITPCILEVQDRIGRTHVIERAEDGWWVIYPNPVLDALTEEVV